jgi:histidinol dehydrogenase
MNIGNIDNHRKREEGEQVYPVFSRRSGGLSLGINLFPDLKRCSFDCPYCVVFPFPLAAPFSLKAMRRSLSLAIEAAREEGVPIKDICFSGNGEPTLSPDFAPALEAAFEIRKREAPEAAVVVITNGTGLLVGHVFETLAAAASGEKKLSVWLKLDAATPFWYERINKSDIPPDRLQETFRRFAAVAPVTIQTMHCAVGGLAPPPAEIEAWEKLLVLLGSSGNIRAVQIYGKARPSPTDPRCGALPQEFLEERARSLREVFAASRLTVDVRVY